MTRHSGNASLHTFIDDILFRSPNPEDIEEVFTLFDTEGRALGMDMNVVKTQLHAMGLAPSPLPPA